MQKQMVAKGKRDGSDAADSDSGDDDAQPPAVSRNITLQLRVPKLVTPGEKAGDSAKAVTMESFMRSNFFWVEEFKPEAVARARKASAYGANPADARYTGPDLRAQEATLKRGQNMFFHVGEYYGCGMDSRECEMMF